MQRRDVLKLGVTGAGGLAFGTFGVGAPSGGGAGEAAAQPAGRATAPFGLYSCGVMSGIHGVGQQVLWTRVAPDRAPSTTVEWAVATDPRMRRTVAGGVVVTGPERDHTVKVLVSGLPTGATLWYQFRCVDAYSPVGRTRTLPAPGSRPRRVRLAYCSCQLYPAGFYTAHANIAADDLDAVVFLGDYIYESGQSSLPGNVRSDPLGTVRTLDGYRAKYRLYRSDPNLQANHAAHAALPVWDDHEFVNNHSAATLAADPERAAAAYQAWFEYMPVVPPEGTTRIHRALRWGDLGELFLLDTRQYRSEEVDAFVNFDEGEVLNSPERSILGAPQRTWMLDGLAEAQARGTRFKLIGNQVMMSPVRIVDMDEPIWEQWLQRDLPKHAGVYLNTDSWDGFFWERDEILGQIVQRGVRDVAVLTGDIHSFWQAGVRTDFDDDATPIALNEFVGGSISSPGPGIVGELADAVAPFVKDLRPGFGYLDLRRKGYGVVELTRDRMVVEFKVVDASTFESVATTSARFTLARGATSPQIEVP